MEFFSILRPADEDGVDEDVMVTDFTLEERCCLFILKRKNVLMGL